MKLQRILLVWRLPAANALVFALFAASVSTDDAVWVNRNAEFHSEGLLILGYYWQLILAHFLLIGFFCLPGSLSWSL